MTSLDWSERAQGYVDSDAHREGADLDLLVAWAAGAGTALDVATGGGHVAHRLRAAGVEVVTCDPAPGMRPDVICRAESLPFADGAFDVVVADQPVRDEAHRARIPLHRTDARLVEERDQRRRLRSRPGDVDEDDVRLDRVVPERKAGDAGEPRRVGINCDRAQRRAVARPCQENIKNAPDNHGK